MFARTDELLAWCSERGIDLELDYANRLSISVADAYMVRDEAEENTRRHETKQAAKAADLHAKVTKAQEKRQQVFDKAYARALRSMSPGAADGAAWEAVAAAETGLPAEVRNQLGGVWIPSVQLASVSAGWAGEGED